MEIVTSDCILNFVNYLQYIGCLQKFKNVNFGYFPKKKKKKIEKMHNDATYFFRLHMWISYLITIHYDNVFIIVAQIVSIIPRIVILIIDHYFIEFGQTKIEHYQQRENSYQFFPANQQLVIVVPKSIHQIG